VSDNGDAMLYEYAIILQSKTDKDGEVTQKARLLKRGEILADDEQRATILVSREIPEEHLEDLERVTLAVRPF
jgi:hypothetical protein